MTQYSGFFIALIMNVVFHAVMWIIYSGEKKIATASELRQLGFTWKICGVWMFLSIYFHFAVNYIH